MENKKFYQETWFIILSIIIFFPVGLFLMWKYTSWNKAVKWIITGLIAFSVIINIFAFGEVLEEEQQKEEERKIAQEQREKQREEDKQAREEEKKKKEEEKKAKEDEKKAKEEKEAKEKEERKKAEEIKVYKNDEGVTVFEQMKTSTLTENTLTSTFSYDMANEFKKHQNEIENGALFRLAIPLVDQYGNETKQWVLAVYYEQETVEKINPTNWPTYDNDGLYTTGDGVITHPVLKGNKHVKTKIYDGEPPFIYYDTVGTDYEEHE